jgi:hypothetical protein
MPGDACDLHIGLLAEMDHSIQTITPALVATIERMEMDELMDRRSGIAKAMYVAQLVDEASCGPGLRAWGGEQVSSVSRTSCANCISEPDRFDG